jgi:hypothetical protein
MLLLDVGRSEAANLKVGNRDMSPMLGSGSYGLLIALSLCVVEHTYLRFGQ